MITLYRYFFQSVFQVHTLFIDLTTILLLAVVLHHIIKVSYLYIFDGADDRSPYFISSGLISLIILWILNQSFILQKFDSMLSTSLFILLYTFLFSFLCADLFRIKSYQIKMILRLKLILISQIISIFSLSIIVQNLQIRFVQIRVPDFELIKSFIYYENRFKIFQLCVLMIVVIVGRFLISKIEQKKKNIPYICLTMLIPFGLIFWLIFPQFKNNLFVCFFIIFLIIFAAFMNFHREYLSIIRHTKEHLSKTSQPMKALNSLILTDLNSKNSQIRINTLANIVKNDPDVEHAFYMLKDNKKYKEVIRAIFKELNSFEYDLHSN